MAEIKSTLDIIMEKTRHLVLSAEERLQVERDEEVRRVAGYVQKLLDGVWNLDQLLQVVSGIPEAHRQAVQQELVKRFVQELGFHDRGRKCLEVLERLAVGGQQQKARECRDLMDRFQEAHRRVAVADTKRLLAQLEVLGISGSAVLVREEKNQEWQELHQDYENQMQLLQSSW
ncbi:MAG TPA: hypothetical protein DEO88_16170 [Syntrophobacteraceae bacterium]|nr:hypothetical protein [Syntrophobacteraceae bacterium]